VRRWVIDWGCGIASAFDEVAYGANSRLTRIDPDWSWFAETVDFPLVLDRWLGTLSELRKILERLRRSGVLLESGSGGVFWVSPRRCQ
jgi:hypothetical protein